MELERRPARRHIVHDAMIGDARHLHSKNIVLDFDAVPLLRHLEPHLRVRAFG
jgi:hypothetical protein